MEFKFLFWTFILSPCVLYSYDISSEIKNRFTVKVDKGSSKEIKKLLYSQRFKLLSEITPETSIFHYEGDGDGTELMKKIADTMKNQIVAWEPVRLYQDAIKPADVEARVRSFTQPNLVCSNYYGMGVEDVWKAGYTGKNIKVAVTDVGINTDLLDLKKNVDIFLSYNFFEDNNDVTPASDPDPASWKNTEHGNMVASIVAAEKDNNICSAGIAYNATIAALKVFEVNSGYSDSNQSESHHLTTGEILSVALVRKLNDIDIFVNAWSPVNHYDSLDLSTLEAIKRGATTGRRQLGRIYVVPSGSPGNALSNNIYTVTVGGVGQNGTLMSDVHRFVDASVLVSALAEGNNLTSTRMVTTSFQYNCVSSFKGLSAAAAQIGGIIALGLQANESLSLRDVQNLLVLSSEYDYLEERNNFVPNGAGLHYHQSLGYGLINASKFVQLVKFGRDLRLPMLLEKRLQMDQEIKADTQTSKMHEVEFCYQCNDLHANECMTSVEHVSAYIALGAKTTALSVTILSPRGTESTLMQKGTVNSEVNGTFVSTHFWNEIPTGTWKIILQRKNREDHLQVQKLSLTLHGSHSQTKEISDQFNLCAKTAQDIYLHDSKTKGNVNESSTIQPSSTTKTVIIVVASVAATGTFIIVICFLFIRYSPINISNSFVPICCRRVTASDRNLEPAVGVIFLQPRVRNVERQTTKRLDAAENGELLEESEEHIEIVTSRRIIERGSSVKEKSQTTPLNRKQLREELEFFFKTHQPHTT